ncbi:ATP-binding cassette domain-containing protein [Roseiconus nitratireducens]|uniref:ATP-binding protein Uup n=1 Tax=Roseiconus nitratireducens TaxID=2605748 RepID=A0A5M6DFL8_9BACT|nr:ATP-binding cassette domain-containing protein [Roseiconus nitratireducens]KAA5546357.1 ATP-binding cassette domain-containing protein [Roseiconus nitratireducens]
MLTIADVTIGFAGPSLLDGVTAQVERGQRIGLLGRNGAGKTTLLKLLAGQLQPDNGEIILDDQTRVARLIQDVPADLHGSIGEIVLSGVPKAKVDDPTTRWEAEHDVEITLSQMALDADTSFDSLSSGMKRRVLLAQAIVSRPDILLLDEPTNHLDIASILWLEDFLSRWQNTLIFITHDRSFLQRLATRIWEIDRGRLFDWSCDYQTFLVRKEQALEAEEKQNALFDKRLAEEEAWIRQGIKARRTRNEGRVKALKAMRRQRQERQEREGTAKLSLQDSQRSGALVAELKDVSFSYQDQPIVDQFSTTVMRGDKIGIIGPNGAGKSTLLKLLLGKLPPDSGQVRLGTKLQIAYFDQLRDTLDPEMTVQENVGEGSEQMQLGNKKKHVLGYLQDYLFTPERARTKVKFLSGGERNRALLAKLMSKPANVLVMDEPTNDLDAETLELLEEQLVEFDGTLLLVSHDRTFLNNVVTSTIVFEDETIRQYVGGYDEWQAAVARRPQESSSDKKTPSKPDSSTTPFEPAKVAESTSASDSNSPRKLSYKEKRELDALPEKIESLEQQIAQWHAVMADPAYYQGGGDKIASDAAKLAEAESELAQAFERWEQLES